MPLWEDIDSADKKKLFKSDDNFTMHSTGFMALDYANGFWQEVRKGDTTIQVPAVGLMGGTFTTVIGTTGSGKSIPSHTMIPTPQGMRKVSDLNLYDSVFDKEGQPTTVLGIFPQGEKVDYLLTFEDGRTAIASPDHLWEVVDPYDVPQVITTKEIELGIAQGKVIRIPMCSPVQYENPVKDQSLYPYALGVILGGMELDISELYIPGAQLDREIILHIPDESKELIALFCEFTTSYYEKLEDDTDAYRFHFVDGHDIMRYSDLFTNSVMNTANLYKTAPYTARLSLLTGLMDVCGYATMDHPIAFTTQYPDVADLMVNIGRSMGYHAYIRSKNNNTEIFFGCEQTEAICSFRVYRETIIQSINNTIYQDYRYLRVKKVEPIGTKSDHTCLYVSAYDHCFITENYVVTHNTTLGDQIGWNIVKDFPDGLLVHCDAEKTSTRQRITQICKCDYDEPRIRLAKSHCSIEDVLKMFNTICDMKEAGGKQYQYQYNGPTYNGKPFMAYVPTVFIIDSLPAFNSAEYNTKDLGNNVDQMRAAKDVTRFYTDCINRAWEYNIMFIVVNHIRPKADMNPYQQPPKGLMMLGPAETLPRGQVAQYYSQTFFRINPKKSAKYVITDNGISGYQTNVQMAKTKTNAVGTSFPIAFGGPLGFDPIYSLYEFAAEIGLIEGTQKKRFHGLEEFPFTKRDFRSTFLASPKFAEAVTETLRPYFETLLGPKPNEVGPVDDLVLPDNPGTLDDLANDE